MFYKHLKYMGMFPTRREATDAAFSLRLPKSKIHIKKVEGLWLFTDVYGKTRTRRKQYVLLYEY